MSVYKCELCGGLPKTKSAYEAHIKTKKHKLLAGEDYEESNFRCEPCGKNYSSEKSLLIHYLTDQHKRWSSEGRPIIKTKGGKYGREKGVPMAKTIKCDECERLFATQYHLDRHKAVHGVKYKNKRESKRKKGYCDLCDRVFQTEYLLKRHNIIHGIPYVGKNGKTIV